MANSFIERFSEDTQDKLTKSMLECSMLFSLNRNPSLSIGRKDMLLQTIFAIICSEEKIWKVDDVVKVFHDKFGKKIEIDLVRKAFQVLLRETWVVPHEDGVIPHEKWGKEFQNGTNEIEQRTNCLFNEVINKVDSQLQVKLTNGQKEKISENISSAFNLYVRMYGFESFVNHIPSGHNDLIEDEDIVNAAINGLDDNIGDLLIEALSELIEKPTSEQANTMMMWVKIFLGTQIMRLDPQLSELESKNLKGKKFILDTDVLLYCLTDNPKRSKSYQRLIKTLRKIGCDLIIPEEVVIEVLRHAQCAERNYNRFKTTLKAVDREIIEEKANNIFVKDFCLYNLTSKHKQYINQYMYNNFLSEDNQLQFMKELIIDKLKIEQGLNERLDIDNDYKQYEEDLIKKIFDRTKFSDTDKWRTDDEIQEISKTDAKLYLSILSLNKNVEDRDKDGMLRANAYLVTFTTKSLKSAQEMNIRRNFVTRPELLINLLAEIGEFDEGKKGFINIFDNPFLAHILSKNWDLIKNFSEVGLNMHDKNITMLRKDLGVVYHKYLTDNAGNDFIDTSCDFEPTRLRTAKNFFEMADEVNKLNYEFMPETQAIVNEYREKSNNLKDEEKRRIYAEKLLGQKVHGYKTYINKIDSKNRRKNLGNKKKKK